MCEYTFEDEVNRKVTEAMDRIISEHSFKIISTSEARVATRAVYESVMGLVGEDIHELLTEAMKEFSNEDTPLFPMHLKTKSGAFLCITVSTYLKCVTVKVLGADAEQKYTAETERGTLSKALSVIQALMKNGATKV